MCNQRLDTAVAEARAAIAEAETAISCFCAEDPKGFVCGHWRLAGVMERHAQLLAALETLLAAVGSHRTAR